MAEVLKIGNIQFDIDDLPEGIDLGGDAMTAVLQYPGGNREVQSFGTQDRNIHLTGQLNYTAVPKMEALDKLFQSGSVYDAWIGPFKRTIIISKFYWTYVSSVNIQYDMELIPAPKYSLIAPKTSTSSSSSSSSSHSSTAPKSVSPKPQKTYVVKKGDSLWKIASKEYKDGSQYKKIYTANHLHTTVIQPGQRLVIP